MSPAAGRRSAADLELLRLRLGRDLGLVWAGTAGSFVDGDLGVQHRPAPGRPVQDALLIEGVDAAVQFLVNRLMTRQGELAPLGHPDYGSRHHELIGEPNTERTRNLVKLYVLQCLRQEARVAKVLSCEVSTAGRPRDVLRVLITLRLVDDDRPLEVVLPFALDGGAAAAPGRAQTVGGAGR